MSEIEIDRELAGRRLRSSMVLAGLKTDELARLVGTSQLATQRHMRGDNLPETITVKRYAEVLGVTTDYLLPRLDSNQEPAGSGSRAVA